jgi:hypothetical protein
MVKYTQKERDEIKSMLDDDEWQEMQHLFINRKEINMSNVKRIVSGRVMDDGNRKFNKPFYCAKCNVSGKSRYDKHLKSVKHTGVKIYYTRGYKSL